jgi:hypothetical protein
MFAGLSSRLNLFLWAVLFLLVGLSGFAQEMEPYSVRPDALTVPPGAHELGESWERMKRAHLEAVAEVLELYPDHEIYFLARDSEILYDTARILLKDEPAEFKRLHLLNVSRANMRAEHVMDYLAQEGISEDALKSGKKVMFVDTGFVGTIPRVLAEKFSPEAARNLGKHLLVSSNEAIPSSRVFLAALNPMAVGHAPAKMHGTIIDYEHMPRYTDRSTGFQFVNGRWEPMGAVAGMSDGKTSKAQAKIYMEDMAAYLAKPTTKDLFRARRELWRELKKLQAAGDLAGLKQRLISLAKTERPYGEAIVRDFLDATRGPISILELGLRPDRGADSSSFNKKAALIAEMPEWQPILEDPETGIKDLIAKGDFSTLGAINDVIKSYEFHTLLAQGLADAEPLTKARAFLDSLIMHGSRDARMSLGTHFFTNPNSLRFGPDPVRKFIETTEISDLPQLAKALVQPHSSAWGEDAIRALAEKLNPHACTVFVDVISKGGGEGNPLIPDFLRALASKGNLNHKRSMAAWFRPSWGANLAHALIHTNDTEIMSHLRERLAKEGFSGSEWQVIREALRLPDGEAKEFLRKKIGRPSPSRFLGSSKEITAGVEYQPGDIVEADGAGRLEILELVESGEREKLYKVQDGTGEFYALKVARNSGTEVLHSFAEESEALKRYARLPVEKAYVTEVTPTYLLKTWVEGKRADEWIHEWKARGAPKDDKVFLELKLLLQGSAERGLPLGDLSPKNLIWDGANWKISDFRMGHEGIGPEDSLSQLLPSPAGTNPVPRDCSQPFQALRTGQEP